MLITQEQVQNAFNFLNELKNNYRIGTPNVHKVAEKYNMPYNRYYLGRAIKELGIVQTKDRIDNGRFMLANVQPKHARDLLNKIKEVRIGYLSSYAKPVQKEIKQIKTNKPVHIKGTVVLDNMEIKGDFHLTFIN